MKLGASSQTDTRDQKSSTAREDQLSEDDDYDEVCIAFHSDKNIILNRTVYENHFHSLCNNVISVVNAVDSHAGQPRFNFCSNLCELLVVLDKLQGRIAPVRFSLICMKANKRRLSLNMQHQNRALLTHLLECHVHVVWLSGSLKHLCLLIEIHIICCVPSSCEQQLPEMLNCLTNCPLGVAAFAVIEFNYVCLFVRNA